MKLEKYKHVDSDRITYQLTINGYELMRAHLSKLDRALLDEINSSEDVTIADQLLGLEMIVRRIEESYAK